mgnify:CR=1 FL=1
MQVPPHLNVPLAECLPLVNKSFQVAKKITPYRDKMMDSANWPRMAGSPRRSALERLEHETLELILSVIQPKIHRQIVRTTDDLAKVTQVAIQSYKSIFNTDISSKDFQAWLLVDAKYCATADWRKIARYYNACPDNTKALMYGFFFEFWAIKLEDMMSAGASKLVVPDVLPPPKTKEVDGDMFVYCELAQDWRRDDVYFRQFEIKVGALFPNVFDILAYAGTLEQAIAKATAITLSLNGHVFYSETGKPQMLSDDALKFTGGALSIRLNCEEYSCLVSAASLIRSVKFLDDATTSQDCRLEWGNCWTGTFTERRFRKALYATEKVFGVHWSKARHLEDALGL